MMTGITLIGALPFVGWYVVIVRKIDKPNKLCTIRQTGFPNKNFPIPYHDLLNFFFLLIF